MPHHPAPRPLGRAVDALCRELLRAAGPELAAVCGDVLDRLHAPLQVAVTGRLSAGKSTLVNALVGRKVAATAAGECTRLVTRFTFGGLDRVDVVTTDGRRVGVALTAEGTVPPDAPTRAGVASADVSHLEAVITSDLLAELTIIDTPGLGSLERTPLAGVQHAAVVGAEAVLHVLSQNARTADLDALDAFTTDTAGRDPGPATVLAVLTKADTLDPAAAGDAGSSVWAAGQAAAAAQRRALGNRVIDVLPVVGLLAETCETGAFTTTDADALRLLTAEDETTRAALLASVDLFTSVTCDVDVAERERLLQRLDLYGVACAVRALSADPQMSAGRLRAALFAVSGLTEVRRRLLGVLAARTDVIKATAALRTLSTAAATAGSAADRSAVAVGIERLLRLPVAHQLQVAQALTLLTSGAVTLPDDLTAEAVRMGSRTDPGERLGLPGAAGEPMATLALERAGWWRGYATSGVAPAQARVAHVVHRAYFLLWQQLTAVPR
ncbi:MAG: dynamin family protein [Mycobacteriaceae bacterium]